ncbi:Long-chain-fatty-acid--CoA ligase 6 [Globomyces sp. JEL0801]|nr:Long-chain-fatty-acid--CoA ligase 6 [Globomyces sp. JEL0801]
MLDTFDSVTILLGAAIVAFAFYSANPTPDASSTRNLNETAVYRNKNTPHYRPLISDLDGKKTVYDMFWHAVKSFSNQNYLASRTGDADFKYLSFKKVSERAIAFGKGLVQLSSIQPPQSDVVSSKQLVGIYLKNSIPWLLADIGLSNLDKVVSLVPKAKFLKKIIVTDVDTIPEHALQLVKDTPVKLVPFATVEKEGFFWDKQIEHVVPKPDDVFTSAAGGLIDLLPDKHMLNGSDRHLPLSHMLERVLFHGLTFFGCSIGFYRGDITLLMDDIVKFEPTLFPAVPRLLNKLYDGVRAKIAASSLVVRTLFDFAYARKLSLLKSGVVTRNTIWDSLVFSKIQARTGGRVRLFITGAAPISPEVLQFIRVVFGVNVVEGYGQTESCASGFVTQIGDHFAPYGCHVGIPFSCSEYKLVDVPEMKYLATDLPNPRGEICFRGPNVMRGYFKEPKKTKETIDEDQWLHTGDVGEILPNLTLKIIDRVKNIFKLAQGEYVAPDAIESKLKSALVAQLFIHGDSLQTCLVAIAVPDHANLLPWAESQGITPTDLPSLCANPVVNKHILNDLVTLGKKAGLKGFEIPKAVYLESTLFSLENGLLTPTFKTKREVVKKQYADVLNGLYKGL